MKRKLVLRPKARKDICGVYVDGVVGYKVVNSKFSVGGRNVALSNPEEDPLWSGRHRGIFSTQSYGMIVDDNELGLDAAAAPGRKAEGIVIGFSGGHNDVVFHNAVRGLERGYIGEGTCMDMSNRAAVGLQFWCNQNENNHVDFRSRILTGPTAPPADEQSIRLNQGTHGRVADNTFDQNAGDYDFINDGYDDNLIGYYWAQPTTPYWPQNVSAGVLRDEFGTGGLPHIRPAGNCLSRSLRVSGLAPTTAEMAVALDDEKLQYGNSRYLYDQLIDGGDRDEVLTEIMSSWPQDAWELRGYLLAKSPYLSMDVLKDMMNKPGFPMAMKAEVCIANPDATKQEGFVKWLQYEAVYPMPENLIANVVASWVAKTYRTQLENSMAYHHDEMTQAAGLWLEKLSADTINDPLDSLRMVWQQVRSQGARYAEAISYMQVGEWQAARTVVANIPQEHVMKGDEMGERGRMLAVIDLLEVVDTDGRTDVDLTTAEQNVLELLAQDMHDRPSTWAQNLLCFYYDRCTPPVTGGETIPKSASDRHEPAIVAERPLLVVMPNPATTWATFEFVLPTTVQDAWIVVMDVQGRTMARMKVNQAQGQLVWDTRQVAPGLYHVELLNNGQRLQVEKLVVKP
ncbi:MAG: T9SS type A sorting domain-containing protein [Flavobacteriales bacterium]|nr:T9SS type A sorting domain-containing protein [Flavobacteriales bacterium]